MSVLHNVLLAALVFLASLVSPPAKGQETTLTFFGWSDQHVKTNGDAAHLTPAVDAMNTLQGTDYPPEVGGKVQRPAFVISCGDCTEWPTRAARDAYAQAVTEGLNLKSFDIVGNHDEGGLSPSPTIKDWIISRHGALSYTFDEGGVHFVAVFSQYDESLNQPAQPITREALGFIRNDLAKLPRKQPVVVVLHLCFDAITNRQALADAFGDSNVILILGGHYHKATVNDYRGYHFVQLPSPSTTTQLMVIRISSERLLAIPYDYKTRTWSANPRVRLDVPIKGPTEKTGQKPF